MAEDVTFTAPPVGMLSEQIDLPDHQLTLGLMHPEGQALRIVAWDGERWRHLSEGAAIKWARELEADRYAASFAQVSDGLRALASKVNEIGTATMFKRAGRAAGASMLASGVIDLVNAATVGRA